MGLTLFLMLNVLGVVFLLYVLVNFRKEARRAGEKLQDATKTWTCKGAEVIVSKLPISQSARGQSSVIPFPPRERRPATESVRRTAARNSFKTQVKRMSTSKDQQAASR